MKIYRPFLSVQEQNDWIAKSAQEGYDGYIKNISAEPMHGGFVYDKFGGIELLQSGYLDVKAFLRSTKVYLEARQMLENGTFDESMLVVQEDRVLYREVEAKKVIYCNGRAAMDSIYF